MLSEWLAMQQHRNSRDGTVARWTQEGRGARCRPIRSRELGPDRAQRILIQVRDLHQRAADRDGDSERSLDSQAALWFGRLIPRAC